MPFAYERSLCAMSGRPRVGTFLGEPDCLVGIDDPLAIERRGGRLGLSLRERHADTFERNNAKDDPRAVGWDQANQSIGQRSMLHLRKGRPKPSFSTIPFVSRVANAAARGDQADGG